MLRPSNGVDTVDAEIGAWNQNACHFSGIDKWFPALYSSVKKSHQSRPRFQVLITNSIEIFSTYCTNILMWFSGYFFSSRMLSFIPRDRRRQKKRERMNDKAHKKNLTERLSQLINICCSLESKKQFERFIDVVCVTLVFGLEHWNNTGTDDNMQNYSAFDILDFSAEFHIHKLRLNYQLFETIRKEHPYWVDEKIP